MSQVLNSQKEETERDWLLEVANLNVSFKKQRGSFFSTSQSIIKAVSDVSFGIRHGEALSIVGESGSGKTTIAKCIVRLVSPNSGSIKFNGVEVTNLKGRNLQNYRRDVQIIYQDPYESLYSRQDVFTAISSPMKLLQNERDTSKIRKSVTDLLEEVDLDPERVMHKLPHQLSGGERQRVNIARALAPNPKLLIADEPTTMLDAAQRFNILRLLMELKSKRNLTVLIITHDLASALLLSNKTIVMYLGRIVESGRTDDVLTKPHHPYVELIRDVMPKLRRTSEVSNFDYSVPQEESIDVSQGCTFRPRCKYATQICAEAEPQLLEKSKSHYAACHNAINV